MRYIGMDSARPGMIVGKSVYNEEGKILVNYRVTLTKKLISRMKEKGLHGLYIEDKLSEDIEVNELISEKLEVKAAQALRKMDIDAALDVASEIAEELSVNGDINVNLMSLRTNSDYTYKHSINVAVLSVLTGMGLGLKKTVLRELATAGLLHDIGKVNIPVETLEKPGALTEEEYELIKKHSEFGYEKIKDNLSISSKTKMGVYMHHENINGTGYPLGLAGEQIYMFAKIIHIADVYDAITSERVYKKAQSPGEAVEFLMKNAGNMFQPEYVKAFLTYIPLYPKGRNVVLSDGSIAVVVENRQHNTLYPVVRRMDGTTLDLSEHEDPDLYIVGFEGTSSAP
ncbi:MAG: HD-GYP domain-containing protein [Lachnospiraceae bacterium]|nr:HD-GYP domain-containing protein [Lachnospiraceae bacterium]